jgi:hypothetical protein
MVKNKPFTLFDWLKEIQVGKSDWTSFNEDQIKVFNSYMIHRYLSLCPDYIELVNYVQKIPHDNKKQIYLIYRDMLPKRQIYYKYPTSSKSKIKSETVGYISKYFECSLGEAEEYISLLPPEGISNILGSMGIEKKEIKKLLK